MSEDDPQSIDLQRRRVVYASHALRYPASFRIGTYATTFVALRPSADGAVPCRIDLLKHGIEGGQGFYPHLDPTAGEIEGNAAACSPDTPLQPLDRASVLRLFGLAGTADGELVEDLADALVSAWIADGVGSHLDVTELALFARTWEAERMAKAGLAELRGLLPSHFVKAATFLAPPGTGARATFGDYTINMLVRDEALCRLVADLGGLAPLAIERWDVLGRSTFGSPAEFVHGVMQAVPMPEGRAVTLDEAEWLLRAFEQVPSANVTEQVGAMLVSYRRAIRFRDLIEADNAALGLVLSFAGLVEGKSAHRNILGLMGALASPDGLPFTFLSGVKRHRDTTGQATDVIAAKLATDAHDLWDAVWDAIGSKVAQGVATLKEPGVLPLLLWDGRDPAVRTLMAGVLRLVTLATCRGNGSEGLLASTDAWVGAGRPGHRPDKVASLFGRGTFREIEFNKDKARAAYDAVLGFVMDVIGLDLLPELQALAEAVAEMGTGMHERWLRQDYPESVSEGLADLGVSEIDAGAPTPLDEAVTGDETVVGSAEPPEEGQATPDIGAVILTGPASWLKRATTLGQALAVRKNA